MLTEQNQIIKAGELLPGMSAISQEPVWLIALDQALENTGIAILSTGKGIIYTSVLKTNKNHIIENRLAYIDRVIEELIRELDPIDIAMEEVYPGLAGRTVSILSQVYCTMTNICHRVGKKFKVYSSSKLRRGSWVKKLDLDGTKAYCRKWLIEDLGEEQIKYLEDHETDAIGILWAMAVDKGVRKDNIKYMNIQKTPFDQLKILKKL